MLGGVTIAGVLVANDITGIGVIDDPLIPVVLVGAAAGAAVVWAMSSTQIDYVGKMKNEIERIQKRRSTKKRGIQYSLRATVSDEYVCFTCVDGTKNLQKGDVWKYGETTKKNRYTIDNLTKYRVKKFDEFSGNQAEIKVMEKVKIYSYFFRYGHLPPGNKIFR